MRPVHRRQSAALDEALREVRVAPGPLRGAGLPRRHGRRPSRSWTRSSQLVIEKRWEGKTLPFPILLDATGKTVKAFGISAYPTNVLIDPEGRVVKAARRGRAREKLEELAPPEPETNPEGDEAAPEPEEEPEGDK